MDHRLLARAGRLVVIGAYVLMRRDASIPGQSVSLGWRGWALAVVGAVSSVVFIAAFKHTYVANVAVIYATVPFMAAASTGRC